MPIAAPSIDPSTQALAAEPFAAASPTLLSAEQVRQFIVDGALTLRPSVPDALHQTILERLREAIPDGTANGIGGANPGNNILPAAPEMRHILAAPEVHGALTTLLGPGYLEHPHRYCHVQSLANTDRAAEPIDVARKVAANCHQDSYTPLAHPRHHHIRYARLMYYPQDTPLELGPTHLLPGTQFHDRLDDEDRARSIPLAGSAGTISITHFDVGHAAGVNLRQQRRFMIKFIFVRATPPTAGPWAGDDFVWREPAPGNRPYRSPLAWSHVWDWLRGAPERYASLRAGALGADAPAVAGDPGLDVPQLLAQLNQPPQTARVAALYQLGSLGEPAVAPLTAALREADDPQAAADAAIENYFSVDDAAHALAAIGTPAVPALLNLLANGTPWVRCCAAFALGEMDTAAGAAVPALIEALADDDYRVVRTAADALGMIGDPSAARPLGVLLGVRPPAWEAELKNDWSANDQIHVNAAMALARLGTAAAPAEAALRHALDDPCGQVAPFALQALRCIATPSALRAALDHLTAARWDPSLSGEHRF